MLNREVEDLRLEPDLSVSDMEADANLFSDDLSVLEDLDANVPALRVADEIIPVSLGFAVGMFAGWPFLAPLRYRLDRPWRRPFFYEYLYEFLRPLRDQRGIEGFESMTREKASATFLRRATEFLATRIAAVRTFRGRGFGEAGHGRASFLSLRQFSRGQQIHTPGCHFTVSSSSNGLRVFWSGAYYVTPNYFSHPTSPAASTLQSGTYIFGVDGGAYGNNI